MVSCTCADVWHTLQFITQRYFLSIDKPRFENPSIVFCCLSVSNVEKKKINPFNLVRFHCEFKKGLAIDCYQCVSANNSDVTGLGCRNPFDQWNVPYVKSCRQHLGHSGHSQEAFACVKIVQTIGERNHHF